nr:MAG TPA: hypothetical protein [Caudoviricetes sp.]
MFMRLFYRRWEGENTLILFRGGFPERAAMRRDPRRAD